MTRYRLCILLLSAALAAGLGSPVAAVDGVLEIHPACIAAGCFPGDGPGFPVEITAAGSYRLTGNLPVPDENTTAIQIAVDGATLDLNGFEIRGVTACSANLGAVTCAPLGTGLGVEAFGVDGVSVRNGGVRGMGDSGVVLRDRALVEGVVAAENGGTGVAVRSGRVAGVVVELNQNHGVEGTASGFPLAIFSSTAHRNGASGFRLPTGTLTASTAVGNSDDGVFCQVCTLTGNQIHDNGGSGIFVLSIATVRGNVVSLNDGFALQAAGPTGYAENTFQANNGGAATQVQGATALEIGVNVCQGDTACP